MCFLRAKIHSFKKRQIYPFRFPTEKHFSRKCTSKVQELVPIERTQILCNTVKPV